MGKWAQSTFLTAVSFHLCIPGGDSHRSGGQQPRGRGEGRAGAPGKGLPRGDHHLGRCGVCVPLSGRACSKVHSHGEGQGCGYHGRLWLSESFLALEDTFSY